MLKNTQDHVTFPDTISDGGAIAAITIGSLIILIFLLLLLIWSVALPAYSLTPPHGCAIPNPTHRACPRTKLGLGNADVNLDKVNTPS
jgi:hypothetical protein